MTDVRGMERCMFTMENFCMPAAANGLYNTRIGRGDMKRFITSKVNGYHACRRWSWERRTLRALMASCSHDARITAFIEECGDENGDYTMCEYTGNNDGAGRGTETSAESYIEISTGGAGTSHV